MKKINPLDSEYMYDRRIPIVLNLFEKRLRISLGFVNIDDNSNVLDIGSNNGKLLKMIRERNSKCKCYGIDTLIKADIKDCDIRIADATDMPFTDNQFQIIFVLDVLEHIKNYNKVISEIYRVLEPNGTLILSGPTELFFYKLCRFLWLRKFEEKEHEERTIFEIERAIEKNGFELVSRKKLPNVPFISLFRISKYIKDEKEI